jgi:CubicO group peptidase (beta-lactamase class C family)
MHQPSRPAARSHRLAACVATPMLALLSFVWIPGERANGADGSSTPAPAPAAPAPSHAWTREAFEAAADYSAKHSGRVMLVMRDGQVLYSRADNSWDISRPHPLASGTKSFSGVMAMMAIQDGLFTLDQRASDFITEWRDDPAKRDITVRHLLTLSSGLAPSDALLGGRGGGRLLGQGARDRARRLGDDPKPDDLFAAALSVPSRHAPGSTFEYGPSHFYAFGAMLERALIAANAPQRTTMAYLQERVFDDLHLDRGRIGADPSGNPNLPGGAALPAESWARFGQFVLDNGRVREPDGTLRQVLAPDLLAQCFVPSAANPAYGLTWWLRTDAESTLLQASLRQADTGGGAAGAGGGAAEEGEGAASTAPARQRLRELRRQREIEALRERAQAEDAPASPVRVFMAAGLGKQRLYVLPDHNLVIVRFAEATTEGRRFSDTEFLALALGRVTPEGNATQPAATP